MGCSWWEPEYWIGWHWINQIVLLLILVTVGYLFYRAIKNGRQVPNRYPAGRTGGSKGVCPNCGSSVEEAFIRCPECHHKLKTNCPNCGKIVKTTWDICPYCEAELEPINK
ncbi:MAG: zinc ribbon domain-containing protein [Calditrichaeota bacterium]|nr:zinc ribbon domain-containing protein [Calditrichota bacterium]